MIHDQHELECVCSHIESGLLSSFSNVALKLTHVTLLSNSHLRHGLEFDCN